MSWLPWLNDNWFSALQSLAIVSGYVLTRATMQQDDRSRRFTNMLQLTANHREIWSLLFTAPGLQRVLAAHPDLERQPITENESMFVCFVILHLNTTFQAVQKGVLDAPEGLGADIRALFAAPLPRAVWEKLRRLQDKDFVAFIESHLG